MMIGVFYIAAASCAAIAIALFGFAMVGLFPNSTERSLAAVGVVSEFATGCSLALWGR
jgi:hypothetical protein